MVVPRLLLLSPSRGFGGGIERVADLVEACWEGPISRLDVYDAQRVASPAGYARLKAQFSGRAVFEAARHRPAVVLALHIRLLPVAVLAARLGGGQAAVMGMGREVWSPMSRLRRLMLAREARLLAISPFTAEILARRAGVPLQSVAVVMLPIAARFARAAAADSAPRGSRPDVALQALTVSRVTRECRYKGHFSVADAVARLAEQDLAPVWTVVGDGDDLPALRDTVERLGIGEHVRLRGYVDDEELASLYRSADVLVLPSMADAERVPPTGEGFGLVYAEAGAYGVPSIASEAGGGSSAFVRDGETGLTVPPGSTEALAEALERLTREPGLRAELGANARRQVLSKHLPGHFGASLAAALRQARGS